MGLAKNNQLESEVSPKSSAHPPLKSSFDVIAGRRDVYRAKLVFYLFLVSLGVFFLAAMIAYCVIRLQSFRPVDQQAFQYLTLNLPTSFWISTLMLVLVSGFLQRAVWHIRRENQLQFRRFLILGWTSAIAFFSWSRERISFLDRSENEQCQQLQGHWGVMAKLVTTGNGLPEDTVITPLRKRS